MSTALHLKDVVKRYGKRIALNGLNLSVPPGSTFALVGSNGAGKTTALAAMMGLIKIQGGEINILGLGSFQPATHGGRVSLLPQDAQLPGHSRVREILLFYGRLQGMDPGSLPHEVDMKLDQVNLLDRANDKIQTLSHGMRRRLTIAQALLGEPDLVLLDEPLNGLDPVETMNIRSIILRRRAGQTLVISSHLLTELESTCDHVAIVENGCTIRQDRIQEFRQAETRILYRVRQGPLPLDRLAATIPEVKFEETAEGAEFLAVLPGTGILPEDVNTAVFACLKDQGLALLEIRLGNNLESAYLQSRKEVQ